MHTTRTLALNDKWDMALTASGNIAVIQNAAATAQNVANECRRFINDSYFDYDIGIPYFAVALGQIPDNAVLRAHLRRAVLRVSDVAGIESMEITGFDYDKRRLHGTVNFRTKSGGTLNGVEF